MQDHNNRSHICSIFTFVCLSILFGTGFTFLQIAPVVTKNIGPFSPQLILLIMYSPTIAALLTCKIFKEKWFSSSEIFGNLTKWHVLALLLPLLFISLSPIIALNLFQSEISFDPTFAGTIRINEDIPIVLKDILITRASENPIGCLLEAIHQALNTGFGISMIAALGEEIGWRGFLLKKVERYGFWKSVFIIGPIWGLWHTPMILLLGLNFPSHPILGIPMMILACTALTPLMIYIRQRSNSIWTAAIFHGSMNGLATLSFAPIHGEISSIKAGPFGISGILAVLIVSVLFFLIAKRSPKIEPVLNGGTT